MTQREVVTRGHLPRWYVPHAAHFVTYRLAGTLPADVVESLRGKRAKLLARPIPHGMTAGERRCVVHKQLFAEYDSYLDSHVAVDWLAKPAIAEIICGNLYHHNASKYRLLCYCIMPNHVHVLLRPAEATLPRGEDDVPCGEEDDKRSPLSTIMHSLKSYTANEANRCLGRVGQFWQHESYDHWVRDEDELERIVAYINNNPVKAGLVQQPWDWRFGSAYDRFRRDGTTSGYLGDLP
jgi:putative DNA methylase